MPRPTSVTAAHGPITFTRQTCSRSAQSADSTSVDTRFSLGSSDTVTFVSAEPIRSTESPCRLNAANTSARKPTCCHMPTDSIDTSVMPVRALIALTLGAPPAANGPISVPSSAGRFVSFTQSGTRASRNGERQRGCSTFAPVVAISCASS